MKAQFTRKNRPFLSLYLTPTSSSYVEWSDSVPIKTGTEHKIEPKRVFGLLDAVRETEKRVLLVGCADEVERTQSHDYLNAAAELRGMWMALAELRGYYVITVKDSTWLKWCTGGNLWNHRDDISILAVANKYNQGVAVHKKESYATCVGIAWILAGKAVPTRSGSSGRLWL